MLFVILLLLLFLLLSVSFFVGMVMMVPTTPLYRQTGYGFVRHSRGDSDGKNGPDLRRTFRHVVVGATCFSLTFTIAMILSIYGSGAFVLAIPLTPVAVWVMRIAVPVRRRETVPDRWRRRSLGTVAIYVGVYLLGAGGMIVLFGALA